MSTVSEGCMECGSYKRNIHYTNCPRLGEYNDKWLEKEIAKCLISFKNNVITELECVIYLKGLMRNYRRIKK